MGSIFVRSANCTGFELVKKILLVSPDFHPDETKARKQSITSRMSALKFLTTKGFMVPLGLATVAALTPDDVEVDIWDEAVHGLISNDTLFEKSYNLVGLTGFINHFGRAKEIARVFRKRGILVAVGGPGVSSEPGVYADHFDVLFIGEAEYTWPRFIADWKVGSHLPEYRQVDKVDMTESPLPRWDSVAVDMKNYLMGAVQTTRGCPFDCEFCDVIYLYGRLARHKSVEQVLEEIRALEQFGIERVFISDDNLIGNPRYAKALLRELILLNNSFKRPLNFHTQLTLNVAKDEEMLELLADANFHGLTIGIETPNIESLIETNKPQNYKTDIIADVKKIHSYALPIYPGMIVGFDHDDKSIFDRQVDFIEKSNITIPSINMLKAPQGTKLWVRLLKEGRVLDYLPDLTSSSDTYVLTNIIPKRMTRVELLTGFRSLRERITQWPSFEKRVKGMISQITRRTDIKSNITWIQALMFSMFILFGMDKEARRTTLRLVIHTLRHAPFMMEKVGLMITHQYFKKAQLPSLLKGIDNRILKESTNTIELQPDPTQYFVPNTFRKPYREIFPDLYQRVHNGLKDKTRTLNSLVEIIYDFLTRWGTTFNQFEEYHQSFINDASDRTVASENNNNVAGAENTEENLTDISELSKRGVTRRMNQLADEVLRSVEQELWAIQAADRVPD